MPRLATAFLGTLVLVSLPSVLTAQGRGFSGQGIVSAASSAAAYFSDRFDWQHKRPEEVGMDARQLDEAVQHAVANDNPETKDLANRAGTRGAHPGRDRAGGP